MDPIVGLTKSLLTEVGEDPDREGLQRTPLRVAQSLRFLTRGYSQDIETIVNGAIYEEDYDEMVSVQNIEFYSLCEHHLLPFFGQCHVAYIPDGKIIGLGKIPRIVDVFARRLQLQERLTNQIAQTIQEQLTPRGVAVVMEAEHLCMMMRGVEKQHSKTKTSAMLGGFRKDRRTRMEFMELIRSSNQ
ncbi:MAG TPA: GTP cyclohydrolase I FolE [candidate division Zixibacteria bacterium]|jgi:GTP cyclohydrolase I|nr:GTP cyclohydrolase I FolE [candidate division Zixibacteria bacterium]